MYRIFFNDRYATRRLSIRVLHVQLLIVASRATIGVVIGLQLVLMSIIRVCLLVSQLETVEFVHKIIGVVAHTAIAVQTGQILVANAVYAVDQIAVGVEVLLKKFDRVIQVAEFARFHEIGETTSARAYRFQAASRIGIVMRRVAK